MFQFFSVMIKFKPNIQENVRYERARRDVKNLTRKLGEKHDDNQSVVVSGMMLLVVLVDVRRVVDTTATALVVGLVRLQLADDPQVDYEDDGEKMVCSDSDAVTQVSFLFFFQIRCRFHNACDDSCR